LLEHNENKPLTAHFGAKTHSEKHNLSTVRIRYKEGIRKAQQIFNRTRVVQSAANYKDYVLSLSTLSTVHVRYKEEQMFFILGTQTFNRTRKVQSKRLKCQKRMKFFQPYA
jgi:hypothetical protein